MRDFQLYLDRPANAFVEGFDSANPLGKLSATQGDGCRFFIHNAVKNTAVPASVVYVEQPLEFTSLRASIGLVDAPANRGTFCFRVGDQTTAPLNWPTDLTPSGLATWKSAALAAIIALSNVAPGDIVISDPTGTPVNFFYYTWTNPARTDVISVVNNSLLPLCRYQQEGSLTSVGYTQLIKLVQFPYAMAATTADPANFTRPMPPVITVGETQPGGAGVDEEQMILVPDDATGSVAFGWTGAQTASLAIGTMTATSIAAALNKLVVDGDSNPSFTVDDRSDKSGRRFAVRCIGPLAGAAQALLTVVMIDQQLVPYAVGVLDLTVAGTALAIEQALNGKDSVDLQFELVIVSDAKEETFRRTITILNDMTDADTPTEANLAGAISVITQTIIVDNSTSEPFATVAPGCVFSPSTAIAARTAATYVHNLGSRNTWVRGEYRTSANGDPEIWRGLQEGELSWLTVDENNTSVTLAYATSNTVTDTYYKGRFKLYFMTPDAVVQIFANLKMTWDQCLDTIPGGLSVRAKFALIDTALGIIGGSLTVPGSSITGTIAGSKIDITSLSTLLQTSAAFLAVLQSIISNATLIDNIGAALFSSSKFVTTLTNLVTSNADLLNALIAALFASPAYNTALAAQVASILQGNTVALTDKLVFILPTIAQNFPALLTDGNYAPVPAAQASPTDLGTYNGHTYLPRPSSSNAGKFYTIGASGTGIAPHRNLFADGDVVYSDGREWHLAEVIGSKYCAADFARELFMIEVKEDMLTTSTQFSLLFQFALTCVGNCKTFYRFRLERGHAIDAASGSAPNTDLASFVVDETLADFRIDITNVATPQLFGYTVTRAADDTLSAVKQIGLKKNIAAGVPGAARFTIRARLNEFDTENVTNPRAQITLALPAGQFASINRLVP